MKAIMAALFRVGTFALTVGAGTVVGLLAIPVTTRVVGADAWAVQVLVQTLATLFGVIVAFGWGTIGPGLVASLGRKDRPQLFLDSLITRAYLFLLTAPAMMIVLAVLRPREVLFVCVASAAYLMPFVGASWYFVGEGRPMRLFLFDALPQLLGTVLGVGILVMTHDLTSLVATQLVFNLCAVVISAMVIFRGGAGHLVAIFSLRNSVRQLAQQRHGVITAATGSFYVNLPMLVVNMLIPAQLASYAITDRLFRFAVTAFSPVLQFVQGWIPDGGPEAVGHRIRRASQLAPMMGLLGGALLAAAGPWAAQLLVPGQNNFGFNLSTPVGVSFAAVAVSQVIGLACLVPIGKARELASSTIVGALFGVPLILLGAVNFGVTGVVWGMALSEVAVAAFQIRVLRRHLRSTG
ncbi:O-antigen/teichoic acid export membrane protein [Pseudarthrobacter defluvii]|uniref:lipopolysaccharide biosynthesis protein n=1 Tax=Pseudarthrobacter defluvii TaxID=410837 RepID=UPI002787CE8D|nr:polysaccharide biosynthesis C-terminal domain-containing protein [Pseudarthrobacter defluvii]MDQ0768572.1 O-antigen/teichoic acid export membrane protein [Pseudarthrobacter defluvii]